VEAIPKQEALLPHEVVLAEAKPEMPQLHLYHELMRDLRSTRSGWRMTLKVFTTTRMKAALTWMSGFLMMELMIGIESLSLSLKFRFKNKFLGFA
jgi:hypothetical protein